MDVDYGLERKASTNVKGRTQWKKEKALTQKASDQQQKDDAEDAMMRSPLASVNTKGRRAFKENAKKRAGEAAAR